MADDGQVHKVIRIVATSARSWEEAARAGVAEATKTITDLQAAKLVESDIVVIDGSTARYRVKLELAFRLDRSRRLARSGEAVTVRRYLVIANQTLPSQTLRTLLEARLASGPAEFHVLVPEPPRLLLTGDPTTGIVGISPGEIEHQRLLGLAEAENRLEDFRREFAHLGGALSGEVGLGDPLSAAQRVLERSSFDEIIVSTLPTSVSRWLKMDLPNRLQRMVSIPVTQLVQKD
jgi:flavin-binding protein dodecin